MMIMVVVENCNKRIENEYQSGYRDEYRGKIKEGEYDKILEKIPLESSRAKSSKVLDDSISLQAQLTEVQTMPRGIWIRRIR
jgi:hypothetical protein